jgi:hypothetical protein
VIFIMANEKLSGSGRAVRWGDLLGRFLDIPAGKNKYCRMALEGYGKHFGALNSESNPVVFDAGNDGMSRGVIFKPNVAVQPERGLSARSTAK